MSEVDTKGVDFADIASVLSGLGGLNSVPAAPVAKEDTGLGGLLKFALSNPQIFSIIMGLFSSLGNLFKKKSDPKSPPVIPPVIIEPPPPPPPANPPPINTEMARINALKEKYYFFERTEGGSKILNKATYDNIIGQSEFLTRGDRIHLDITPLINNQVMGPESGRKDELLLQDATKGDVEENHCFDFVAIVDGKEYHSGDTVPGENWDGQDVVFLTSEYDDYGCTPVMTVNRDLELGREHTVSGYAIYTDPKTGNKVQGNKLSQVIVKPWGN